METPDAGVLSGYNARGASWKQTAEDFVPPARYWQLVDGQDHQRLFGPRGIGKTTLLKMLCSQALEHWVDRDGSGEAARAREQIDFCGVLIPAKKMWSGQLSALTSHLVDEHRARFGLAAFAYMALGALVETAEHRARRPTDPTRHLRIDDWDDERESEVARRAAELFFVPEATASLKALRLGLAANAAKLSPMLRRAANSDVERREFRGIVTDPLLDVDFYSAASYFVTLINDAAGEPERNWAFLLDELEFLSDEAQQEIAGAMQGQDVRLRFKVSLAPWTQLPVADLAMPFNDFTPINLMPERREEADHFARRLFVQEMAKREIETDPEILLGRGGFENDEDAEADEQGSYADGGSNQQYIEALTDIDPSFAEWLSRLASSPNKLPGPRDNTAAYGQVRKAAPLVRLRLAYYKGRLRELENGEKGGRALAGRSRKRPPDLYAGTHSIWAMSEGNPRWLKAFVHELVTRWDRRGHISGGIQVRAAERVAAKYMDYFRAVNVADTSPGRAGSLGSTGITPYELVERLGLFFREQVHSEQFSADPATMVRVDVDDEWIKAVLNSLIFLGGLVTTQASDGERLRLAHMFSPRFRLPLRNGKAVSLKRALEEAPKEQLTFPAYDGPSA